MPIPPFFKLPHGYIPGPLGVCYKQFKNTVFIEMVKNLDVTEMGEDHRSFLLTRHCSGVSGPLVFLLLLEPGASTSLVVG